jgi:cytochrome bd-type quinol oxidase subunit 2
MKIQHKLSAATLALSAAIAAPFITHAGDFGVGILNQTDLPKNTPSQFITNIINTVTGILGVVLVGMLVFGGALYLSSAGNEQRIEAGKKTITYAIVGTIVVAAARIIAEFVIRAVT